MQILLLWIINAFMLVLVARILPGFTVESFYAALITSVILGLVNAVIRPLVLFLTLPVNILTLGLFTFVVNALMILLVSTIVKGFSVDSFATAFWAALILWLISFLSNWLAGKNR